MGSLPGALLGSTTMMPLIEGLDSTQPCHSPSQASANHSYFSIASENSRPDWTGQESRRWTIVSASSSAGKAVQIAAT